MNDIAQNGSRNARRGLRFACLLDGKGGCRDVDWNGVRAWQPADGVLWIHLERDDPDAQAWLEAESGIDSLSVRTLIAEESRPRIEDVGDALMMVLRGVNVGMDEDEEDPPASQVLPDGDMVPIHLWVEERRVISLRDKGHQLIALRDIRDALRKGKGPITSGGVTVKIAEKVVKYAEPIVAELEANIDDLDDNLNRLEPGEARRILADARHKAIELRRYLAPQREALLRPQTEEFPCLSPKNFQHLREVADKVQRHIESLDAIRSRAAVVHEDLAAIVSERIATSSHRLTVLAGIVLPPSLVAGMLGANIGGVPGQGNAWAFPVFALIVLVLIPLEIWVLKKLKWF
ncbi:MAG: zinc transporter ZntB [Alphaproteobacteria bacterium]|nr:zinc transporter ZntB [Alphaproteobacteria bacterium]